MTQGGPGDATRMLSELVYDTAFSFLNIGKATAMSFVLLLLSSFLLAQESNPSQQNSKTSKGQITVQGCVSSQV